MLNKLIAKENIFNESKNGREKLTNRQNFKNYKDKQTVFICKKVKNRIISFLKILDP